MRTVVTVHDMTQERFPALFDCAGFVRQKRTAIRSADAVIAVSRATKEDILRFVDVPEDRITVVHHGASEGFTPAAPEEIAAFRTRAGLPDVYWLYVGHRYSYKNFGVVLKAVSAVRSEVDCALLLAGGDPRLTPAEMAVVNRGGLQDSIVLMPGISDEDLRLAYAGCAAFIFPSVAEGFGLPLLEAMGAGAPVLCSDTPVFREVAADAAAYFDPHDEAMLAEQMLLALDDGVQQSLVEKGRARVGRFSWEKAASATAATYMKLAEG